MGLISGRYSTSLVKLRSYSIPSYFISCHTIPFHSLFLSNKAISFGVSQIEEESKKKFVGEALDLDISSIATSLTSSKLIEWPSTSPLDFPLHKANLHVSML